MNRALAESVRCRLRAVEKRDLAGPKQDGPIAEHHGCKVATGEDEGETERDADDEPDGAHVAAFMVKFSLIRGEVETKIASAVQQNR